MCHRVRTITECLMALIKQEVGIFYSQCLKNSVIKTELLIMRWRILKSDHFSAERNLQARSESLRGIMKIICLLGVRSTPFFEKKKKLFSSQPAHLLLLTRLFTLKAAGSNCLTVIVLLSQSCRISNCRVVFSLLRFRLPQAERRGRKFSSDWPRSQLYSLLIPTGLCLFVVAILIRHFFISILSISHLCIQV